MVGNGLTTQRAHEGWLGSQATCLPLGVWEVERSMTFPEKGASIELDCGERSA